MFASAALSIYAGGLLLWLLAGPRCGAGRRSRARIRRRVPRGQPGGGPRGAVDRLHPVRPGLGEVPRVLRRRPAGRCRSGGWRSSCAPSAQPCGAPGGGPSRERAFDPAAARRSGWRSPSVVIEAGAAVVLYATAASAHARLAAGRRTRVVPRGRATCVSWRSAVRPRRLRRPAALGAHGPAPAAAAESRRCCCSSGGPAISLFARCRPARDRARRPRCGAPALAHPARLPGRLLCRGDRSRTCRAFYDAALRHPALHDARARAVPGRRAADVVAAPRRDQPPPPARAVWRASCTCSWRCRRWRSSGAYLNRADARLPAVRAAGARARDLGARPTRRRPARSCGSGQHASWSRWPCGRRWRALTAEERRQRATAATARGASEREAPSGPRG